MAARSLPQDLKKDGQAEQFVLFLLQPDRCQPVPGRLRCLSRRRQENFQASTKPRIQTPTTLVAGVGLLSGCPSAAASCGPARPEEISNFIPSYLRILS
jgi:hypothetical protein